MFFVNGLAISHMRVQRLLFIPLFHDFARNTRGTVAAIMVKILHGYISGEVAKER